MTTYEINDTFPTPIVADFETFLTGVESPKAYLTKAKLTLDRSTLHGLDAQMRTHRTAPHPRTDQEYYPLLDLFQRTCMAARFHVPKPAKGELRMAPTEAVAAFRGLSPCEKYVALLKTFWVDADWSNFSQPGLVGSLEALVGMPVGKSVKVIRGQNDFYIDYNQHSLLRAFSFFGWLIGEESTTFTPYGKGKIAYETVTISEFGHDVLNALLKHRRPSIWNKPLFKLFRGVEIDFSKGKVAKPSHPAAGPEPFYKALLPLFPAGALTQDLPQAERKTKNGTFVFKVSVGDVWRKIAMSGEHTLEDLHVEIQTAFDFDNDHLFAFYMDNKRYSKNCYNDSRGDEGPFAEEAKIGQLDLWLHQHFIYFFDFGDSWTFDVELAEIRDTAHKGDPKILESKGKNPKQYRYADDDDEDESEEEEGEEDNGEE